MNASDEILNEGVLNLLDLTATAIAKQKYRPKRRGRQVTLLEQKGITRN
jgi:hypothetical protein